MGNSFGESPNCAVFCNDVRKRTPFIHVVMEEHCRSFMPPTVQYTGSESRGSARPSIDVNGVVQVPSTAFIEVAEPRAARRPEAVSPSGKSAPLPPPGSDMGALLQPADANAGRSPAKAPRQGGIGDSEPQNGSDLSSAAASDSTAATAVPDIGQAQLAVKNFVRTYVKGRDMSVLSLNGGIAMCHASLDRKLSTLSLQRCGKKDAKKRGIPLEDINEICIGEEAGDDVELAVDGMCVTLLLQDGQAVGFRFDDIEERDTFALCLSMFVDARRSEAEAEAERKKGKAKAHRKHGQ
mmetsp:Transcript_97095/g.274450  ORF Transcript_97095/g.274450 Transcript_97095/m.274450 type:complete len:295 (+) Transcript_97095:114-998(+)|eukprot:CAMPEP_0117556862 /NCGR_PEP_ID=MMETSP0784-20121206/52028_1 /TAXON_ID=39447 /ORGANISM="" /LENGTH=294 /DNA_ID=CAMNT_0005354151 /DNA_START=92 /DNA_END=976 /DNA_ORIENTATION=-